MATFRIDDVSLNTDFDRLAIIVEVLRQKVPDLDLLLVVSPAVHDLTDDKEIGRVFPKVMGALSDHRAFFRPSALGVPWRHLGDRGLHHIDYRVAGHGLIHLDHRLLGREAQEMSILISCSVVNSKIFVPPFNKYNKDTVEICAEHGISLVRWEDGWRHVQHNAWDPAHRMWYLHEHDTDPEQLMKWFEKLEIS